MKTLEETMDRIAKFVSDRDWEKFHTPANLSKSISIEANELLEHFQWDEQHFDLDEVKDELADVLNYCLQMCMVLHVNPTDIIESKLDKVEKKYPIEKAKGNATKYNKL